MLIAVSTGVGLQQKIREKIAGFSGHVTITSYDNNSVLMTAPIKRDQAFYPDFEQVPGVKHLQVFANRPGIIKSENDFEGVVLKGVGADYDRSLFELYLQEGRFPLLQDGVRNDSVLLSSKVVNSLNLKLGDKFKMYFLRNGKNPLIRYFTIGGIFSTGVKDFDDNFIVGDINHVQRINKWQPDEVGGFEVILRDIDDTERLGEAIYREIGYDLDATTMIESNFALMEWLKLFDVNILVILIIMIAVAGVNMITALLILILEQTRLIGMLKAMGANNWSIRSIFLQNAAFLIAKGLLWGNLIGIGLLLLQKYFGLITLDEATYYVKEVPVLIDPAVIIALNVGTMLLCLLMLLVPSYLISKIDPVKAIRFD